MRIRTSPAVGFGIILILAAYLGLAPPTIPAYKQSDKALHFITFLLLTLCFYWILETNRRKNLQLTLLVCPLILGVGSEIVQAFLPNGRDFDFFDIVANVFGSLSAVALNLWYHKRMLERKRRAKTLIVPGEGGDDVDVELGEGSHTQDGDISIERTLEEEVDNWDENAEDWDEDEPGVAHEGSKTSLSSVEDATVEQKKRND